MAKRGRALAAVTAVAASLLTAGCSASFAYIALAHANGVPVVGVYETMPVPGYHYQSWMLAEVQALRRAVANQISTEQL